MRTDKILTHEDWQDSPLEVFLVRFRLAQGLPPQLPSGSAPSPVVAAYINQGRWVAECPGGDGGALVVTPGDPRFMCTVCWNMEVGGRWLQVGFPPNRAAIERVLLLRPARDGWQAAHRNWYPTETLSMLRAENLLRGWQV